MKPMIQKLTIDNVLQILKKAPEQCVFDWKQDLHLSDENKKAEFIKDIVAVANATTTSTGFVFYGVNPRRPDPLVGLTQTFDDATLQQMVCGKIDPPPEFLYYEVCHGAKVVGVIHIPVSHSRPHIIAKDYGKLREGQILIRRGSSTGGIKQLDLFELFYGGTSPYFQKVLHDIGADAQFKQAQVAMMQELRQQQYDSIRHMEITAGLPPGSLGGR